MFNMRIPLIFFFALGIWIALRGQVLDYTPAYRNFSNQERLAVDSSAKFQNGFRNTQPCPPEFTGNLVVSGDSITVTVDTFGLSKGNTSTLTLLTSPGPKYGTAYLSGIKLIYKANPGFNGLAEERLVVQYEESGRKVSLEQKIYVTRRGRVIIADARTVQSESITRYCLDNELSLNAPTSCSQLLISAATYDGKGSQSYHFTSYSFPDTCIMYYASRFAGGDTVSVRICDMFAVCDTFRIPFNIRGDTLRSLPFFDDFSSYKGTQTSNRYWLDRNVYLNNTLAPNPPSLGFATFDGLDRHGNPYEIVSGPGDYLTSIPVDLSGYKAGSDVTLKFYLAPKGYGQAPDITDSMFIEFRNNLGKWVRMAAYPGLNDVSIDSIPSFVFRNLRLNDAQFFHKAFQFRFIATTSPGGAVDLWHLDYVRLAANEGLNNTFPDVAFTQIPTSLLKSYTSMPWWQFRGFEDKEMKDKMQSNFFSHFDFQIALGSSNVSFRETTTNTPFNQNFTVVETGQDNNMPIKTPVLRNRTVPAANFTGIKQNLANIPSADFRNLETKYVFTVTAQPSEYQANDTVILNTPFANYFAHDDGTAEWQVFVKFAKGGEQMASRFSTNIGDTLRAVQMMFPHVAGDVQDQQFKLMVWTADPASSKPVYESRILKPFYANNVLDTIHGFTTYRLEDISGKSTPVFIPPGNFWVGWVQHSSASLGIPVGFDLQNACECNFSNINGVWKAFPSSLKGSLMIRPVFGKTAPKNTINKTLNTSLAISEVLKIYPNPGPGVFNLELLKGDFGDYQFTVFNQLGQRVHSGNLQPLLNIPGASDGWYILRLRNKLNGELMQQKLLIEMNKTR
jgi:hypothetical protein